MRKMTESNFEDLLISGGLSVPPLEIKVVSAQRPNGEDAILDVAWRNRTSRFVVELKSNAKPQTLKLATQQAKEYASACGEGRPMVIAPFISGTKLEELLDAGVSALDFCGNGAVETDQFFFFKTGNPNQYRDSAPIRSAYRGDSSLVARVFLLQPQFQAVGDILEVIKERGGSLTFGTVSKALKRLESDLVIERPSRSEIKLIQVERLLDQLLEEYQPPKTESTWEGKVELLTSDLLKKLERISTQSDIVRTGNATAQEYAVYAGEPIIECYCRDAPSDVLGEFDVTTKQTKSFSNLRLLQTNDQRVYFDRRPELAASPIQSWLEMATGDKRQEESSEQIKQLLRKPVEPST